MILEETVNNGYLCKVKLGTGWLVIKRALGKPSRRARARRPVLYSALREMPSLIYALKGAGGAGETRGRAGEAGGGREGAGTD